MKREKEPVTRIDVMYAKYAKVLIYCILISTGTFAQNETSGIAEEKESTLNQQSIENSEPENKDSTASGIETQEVTETSGGEQEAPVPQQETAAQTPVTPVSEPKSKEPEKTPVKSEFTNVSQLRSEAQLLREEAEKLYTKADKFKDDVKDIDDDIDDLEDLAEDLEDEATKLLKQAKDLQLCIKQADEARNTLDLDTTLVIGDTGDTLSPAGDMRDHKTLMLKMRQSANQLLTKTREIAVQVREMKEASGEKEELSEAFEDKATLLEGTAEQLEEAADSLEDHQSLLPLAKRFRIRLGHQIRISAVPPFNDRHAHILIISGIHVSWYFKNYIGIGCEDISLRFQETIYGTRVAICGSPVVSYSFFPVKKLELGVGIGTALQGQVGADRKYTVAAAPFIKLFNETWVASRFSLGPVLKINYGAANDLFTRVLPSDNNGVLPQKAWWMDVGITYTFHF